MREELRRLLDFAPEAKARFEFSRARYAAQAEKCAGLAIREEWTATPRYSPYPFGVERLEFVPGRVLKSPPRNRRRKWCYGFSTGNEIVYAHHYTDIEDRKAEEYWEYSPDRIETTQYDYFEPDKSVINVQTVFLRDGRPSGFIRYATRGLSVEVYDYDQGTLVRAYGAAREHDPNSAQHALTLTNDEFIYDRGQLIQVIRTWETGDTEQLFPRRKYLGNST